MNEKPILFSGEMVRAILRGKTQTRRVVKPQPQARIVDGIERFVAPASGLLYTSIDAAGIRCPYGQPGDRLWVRESGLESKAAPLFRTFVHDVNPDRRYWVDSDGGRYGASFGEAITRESMIANGRWKVRPSIHMPRWACRIVLEITDVRVERLQDISESDARAEGCNGGHDSIPGYHFSATPREHFWKLWDSLNAKRAPWASNPWVWALTFRKMEHNE